MRAAADPLGGGRLSGSGKQCESWNPAVCHVMSRIGAQPAKAYGITLLWGVASCWHFKFRNEQQKHLDSRDIVACPLNIHLLPLLAESVTSMSNPTRRTLRCLGVPCYRRQPKDNPGKLCVGSVQMNLTQWQPVPHGYRAVCAVATRPLSFGYLAAQPGGREVDYYSARTMASGRGNLKQLKRERAPRDPGGRPRPTSIGRLVTRGSAVTAASVKAVLFSLV